MARIGRRAFLIGGAGVAALGATGGVALFAPFAPTRNRRWLTQTEAAAALALAQTLFSGGAEFLEYEVWLNELYVALAAAAKRKKFSFDRWPFRWLPSDSARLLWTGGYAEQRSFFAQ